MFTERVDLNFDEKLMQLLNEGRARAAGLLPAASEQEEPPEEETTPKVEKKEFKPNGKRLRNSDHDHHGRPRIRRFAIMSRIADSSGRSHP